MQIPATSTYEFGKNDCRMGGLLRMRQRFGEQVDGARFEAHSAAIQN